MTESLLQPSPKVSHEPEQVYQVARDGIAKQDHLAYLKPMSYQNTYAVAVPKKIAQEYGLKTISDLKKVEGQLKAGFTLEFNDREDGNKGLQSMYGLNLNVATMQPALRYQAIQSGIFKSRMPIRLMRNWSVMIYRSWKMTSNSSHLIKGLHS